MRMHAKIETIIRPVEAYTDPKMNKKRETNGLSGNINITQTPALELDEIK